MRPSKKLIVLLLLPLLAFQIHEYYISLTKIEFAEEQKAVQITMKVFIDDIENALEKRYEQPMELSTKDEHEMADAYLNRYLNQKFKVWINGELQSYNYLGKEYEHDVVFLYLEILNIDRIRSIEIMNALLMDEFPSQLNYIKLKVGDVDKTFILTRQNDKEMLKF